MIGKQTTLELNGPNISFTTQPQSVTINSSGNASFVGIATATFPVQNPPNPATGTGLILYEWYEKSFGKLSDVSNSTLQGTISGSGTTTLTISGSTRNNLEFYVVADYAPSAYGLPGVEINAGTARSTGNATNEPVSSSTATLTIRPLISVTQNPSSASVTLNVRANFSAGGSSSDGTSVSYRWQLNNDDIFDSSNISGSETPNLSVSLPSVSSNTVRAKISHPTASNSPIFTNSANFIVVDPRQIINFEGYRGNNGVIIAPGFGSVNLFNGPYTNIADALSPNRILSIYAAERDLPVRITMAGAAGVSRNGFGGGEGGVSVFEINMVRDIEYIIRLGSTTFPSGGTNGGGGASFLFERARTIALCGGGGGAGTAGPGGNGGGISVSGLDGFGRNSGVGGGFFAPGTLPPIGFDATSGSTAAGRHSTCAWGDYWVYTGLSRCENFPGLTQAKTQSATNVSGTASINRGFKPGNLGARLTGGNGSGNDGGGGSGAVGGSAATEGYGSGGGGGSGYHDGSINLTSTRSGGNASTNGFLIIQSLL